jgi:hypothetical protein
MYPDRWFLEIEPTPTLASRPGHAAAQFQGASPHTDEKARCAAILKSPEAKGREAMAMHLALKTDVPADAAIQALRTVPAAAPVAAAVSVIDEERAEADLILAFAHLPNREVAAGAEQVDNDDDAKAEAKRILAFARP